MTQIPSWEGSRVGSGVCPLLTSRPWLPAKLARLPLPFPSAGPLRSRVENTASEAEGLAAAAELESVGVFWDHWQRPFSSNRQLGWAPTGPIRWTSVSWDPF